MGFKILTYQAFTPTDISGIKAWYDASTLTGADGSSVSSWLDQSGNEAHMFQSTSAAQPLLKTNVLNGRNVVRFDGVDDFLNMTAPFDAQPTTVASLNATSWSKTGRYLFHSASPTPILYKVDGNKFTKLPTISPITGATALSGPSWTVNDLYLIFGTQNGSRIYFFKRSSGDTFTKVSDPATLPNSTVYSTDSFYDGTNTYVAASGGGDRLFLYKNDGTNDTFTLLTAPTTLPSGTQSNYCKFSPDGNFLYVSSNATPYITFYSRSGDTFTKLNDPSSPLTNAALGATWIDEQNVVVGITSAFPRLYTWDGTTFQMGSSVGTYVQATNNEFDSSKTYLAIASNASPYFIVYKRSGSTYTLTTAPKSIPASTGRGVSWSPDSQYVAISHTSAPFIQIYKREGDNFVNLNRLNMLRNVGGSSVFAVVKYPATATSQSAFYASNGTVNSSARTFLYQRSSTGIKYTIGGRRLDADLFQAQESVTAVTNTFVVHSGVIDYANNDAFVYLNGSLDSSTTGFQTQGLTSDTDSLAIQISNSTVPNFLNGDIAEIIVYNRALSANEIKTVHQYLGRKWGITIA